MYEEHGQAIVAPLATLSLDKLAEFAIEEKLINGFHVANGDVTIVQSDRQFILPHRQASTFLIGMLRGRSWYINDDEPTIAAPAENQRTPEELTIPVADNNSDGRNLDATLDALLTFTQDVGIIRAYSKAPAERLVYIDISACTSVFSYADALGYLFDCVQHEVRSMTEAA